MPEISALPVAEKVGWSGRSQISSSGDGNLTVAKANGDSLIELTSEGSFTAGLGHSNTADYAFCHGRNNTITSEAGFAIGQAHNVSSNYAGAAGSGNTVDNELAFAFGASLNVHAQSAFAIGANCEILDGSTCAFTQGQNLRAYLHGQQAFGAVGFSIGKSQGSRLVIAVKTSDETPTQLFLDVDQNYLLIIPTGKVWGCTVRVVGHTSDLSNCANYELRCLLKNSGGTVSTVGSVGKTIVTESNSAWDANLIANNSDKCLDVLVTGEAATNIQWVAVVELVESAW